MSSHLLSNSPSAPSSVAASSADQPRDTAVSSSPVTTSSSVSPDIWAYLWFPLLFYVSKELPLTRAERSSSTPSTILLPSQVSANSSSSPSPEGFSSVTQCVLSDSKLNYKPVIGILSHPGDGASGRLNDDANASYIAASYVKFVESPGGRVIPLIYNEPREILFEKLNLVNGVLFTGGWAKTGLYFDVAEAILEKVLAKNDEGHHFPLYAICLGFEVLSMIISKADFNNPGI